MKNNVIQSVGIGFLVVIVGIQFFPIQTNRSVVETDTHFSKLYAAPPEINNLLARSCYDCHSNNTRYPWYSHIQPIGWWLENHVLEGKKELNLSEFANYSVNGREHKLEEMIKAIDEGWMPLKSYAVMHPKIVFSEDEKTRVLAFLDQCLQSSKQD